MHFVLAIVFYALGFFWLATGISDTGTDIEAWIVYLDYFNGFINILTGSIWLASGIIRANR